jgi:hypothetical protein
VWSGVWDWRHVLLMNMPCLHLQIWQQWQPTSWGNIDLGVMGKVTLHRGNNFSFQFYIIVLDCYMGCILNGTPCIIPVFTIVLKNYRVICVQTIQEMNQCVTKTLSPLSSLFLQQMSLGANKKTWTPSNAKAGNCNFRGRESIIWATKHFKLQLHLL